MKYKFLENSEYVLNPQSNVWSRHGYGGIGYSDGDEIEERIAKIIREASDVSVLSVELRQHFTDWPSLYHLSGTRANIIRPLSGSLQGDVLEIGAGCGAITRYLGESGLNVLALEGSTRRAEIARARTAELENVTVLAEKFNSFNCKHKFDVITLIGVLEYANMFTPSDNPALSMLQQARAMLKPDGKLIIAIENQLGLKYFAGAPEDHIGRPMYGIEGRYKNDQPQTFGKEALSSMLGQAGFLNAEYLAPFPDYKLPVSVLTESGISASNFDASAFAWQSVQGDPQLPSHTTFSLELVWPEIFKNKLAIDMANSFLVLASAQKKPLHESDQEILAFHYSTNRVPEYCKETRFQVNRANKNIDVIYNKLFGADVSTHLSSEHVVDFICSEKDVYSNGRPMSWDFLAIITQDEWTTNQVVAFVKKYLSAIQFFLTERGIDIRLDSVSVELPGEFLDVTPQNIIVKGGESFTVIDTEWQLKENVQLGHLLFRSFFSMISSASKFGRPSKNGDLSRKEFIRAVMFASGFKYSDSDFDEWVEIELRIQEDVSGQSVGEFFRSWPNGLILTDDFSQAVVNRDNEIKTLSKDNADKSHSIENLQKIKAEHELHIQGILRALAEKDMAINNLRHSTSWRLTAPLRLAGKVFRKPVRIFRMFIATISLAGGFKPAFRKALNLWKQDKWSGLSRGYHYVATRSDSQGSGDQNDYVKWISEFDSLDEEACSQIAEHIQKFASKPLLSIVMPVYNANVTWLDEAIESVRGQLYENWELCIADDHSTNPELLRYLKEKQAKDSRIKVVFREENGHISAASNSALEVASGDWILLLDQDDLLSEQAFYWVVRAIHENPDSKLLYSDEDKINESGVRNNPYFKSDWNRSLFYSQNMICHLGVYSREIVDRIGGFREGLEGAQDHDLALRFIECVADHEIVHIPRVLYHWRVHPQSTAGGADAKPYAVIAGERAIQEHLDRSNIKADVVSDAYGYRVKYRLPDALPRVSLVIPTRNGLDLVRTCIESIISKTTYPDFEIILVDNGSDDPECLKYFSDIEKNYDCVRVKRDDRPFNYSALNNSAIEEATGEIVGLVNNDIEVIEPDWLSEMVSIAIQPDVGAVGAKLLYPDNRVQHAGVIIGLGGVAGHGHLKYHSDDPGYFSRLNVISEYSAVTAACLLVKKSDFERVGGLNEENLSIAFNDVDLCLKLKNLGLRNIWTPYALLYHHESATRGYEDSPEKIARFNREAQYMRENWGKYIAHDPCYSPNLTLTDSDFSMAWPPRVKIR